MIQQFRSSPILYAQGSTLAAGAAFPSRAPPSASIKASKPSSSPHPTGPAAPLQPPPNPPSKLTGRTPSRCPSWPPTTTLSAGPASS
jgi:hypothetical protein